MDYENTLNHLLGDLSEATGITFRVSGSTLDEEATIARLREIVNHTRSASSRTFFLRRYLTGELIPEEIERGIHQYHMNQESRFILLLLALPHAVNETERSILSGLYTPHQAIMIPMNASQILVMKCPDRPYHGKKDSDESSDAARAREIAQEAQEAAASIVEVMNSDAMTNIHVAVSGSEETLLSAPAAYADLAASMRIGQTFYPSRAIYNSHQLGLARIIMSIPRSECIRYMEDHFTGFSFDDIDADTMNAITTLFYNNLSIAETSRQLFLHRNTLVYRLDKFQKVSGLDIRGFDDAITCRIGMMITDRLKAEKS